LAWNVEGIMRKDFEFYQFVNKINPEILFFSETWCRDKCILFEQKLPNYEITYIPAVKVAATGRAKGGIIFATRVKVLNLKTRDNTLTADVMLNNLSTKLVCVYAPPDESGDKILKEVIDELENCERFVLIGDLNARIGECCPPVEEFSSLQTRVSMDLVTNKRGKVLTKAINENGWCVMNGSTSGDSQGSYTFRNMNGASVIDLCICSAPCTDDIINFKVVLSSQNSCHDPILLTTGNEMEDKPDEKPNADYLTKVVWDSKKKIDFVISFSDFMMNMDWTWANFKAATYHAAQLNEMLKKVPLAPQVK
jgi:exonuclease III